MAHPSTPRSAPLPPGRTVVALRCCAAFLALVAAGCGDTLVDSHADPTLLAVCDAGQAFCGGSCVAEGPTSCGPACADCTTALPANASGICTAAHACAFECDPGWLRSGGQCVRATAVTAGYVHTCALLADGGVKCWGANDRGQLGDGTGLDSSIPVDVSLPAATTAVAAGYAHTCALVAGAVWCWGDNTTGEIGDGTTTNRASPVQVPGLSGAVALAAGGDSPPTPYGHTCAVVSGGDVWCWGFNGWGQLGDGAIPLTQSTTPVRVVGLTAAATAVAAGGRHSCALLSGGGAMCWGADDFGQLGDGSGGMQQTPVPVSSLAGATFLAAGLSHTCAATGGGLLCWGLNTSGQVDPATWQTNWSYSTPHAPNLGGLLPTDVAGGRAHTCALQPPSGLTCFGADNAGQLGGSGKQASPTLLAPGTATGIAAGGDHGCALTADGGVQCWGADDRGQLGDGQSGPPAAAPVYVSGR